MEPALLKLFRLGVVIGLLAWAIGAIDLTQALGAYIESAVEWSR